MRTDMGMADYQRAYTAVSQTVAANDFSINHDVDGIMTDLWATYGHFDFDLIDVDRFWSIVADHENN